MAETSSFMESDCGYPNYFVYAVMLRIGRQATEPATTCQYTGLDGGPCENTFALTQKGYSCMIDANGQPTQGCPSTRDENLLFDPELRKRAALAWVHAIYQKAYEREEDQ